MDYAAVLNNLLNLNQDTMIKMASEKFYNHKDILYRNFISLNEFQDILRQHIEESDKLLSQGITLRQVEGYDAVVLATKVNNVIKLAPSPKHESIARTYLDFACAVIVPTELSNEQYNKLVNTIDEAITIVNFYTVNIPYDIVLDYVTTIVKLEMRNENNRQVDKVVEENVEGKS